MQKIQLLHTEVHNLSMEETLDFVVQGIKDKKHLHQISVNAGKIVALQNDKELQKSIAQADLINADGQAVIWASKLLGKPIKERVAGIDLMTNLIQKAAENKFKVYFLGAKEAVVKTVAQKYEQQYGKDLIGGYRNGYFTKDEEEKIIQTIVASGSQLLFVAIPSPQKELFLYRHRASLQSVNFIMGVGGSFDVVAGFTKRAPIWMQKAGLEWFYRFLQEPKRMWKRYLIGNTKFLFLVLKERFFN
ncbi:MAG: WecB/TagA/CpsF family glycosyltransferase [Bacteroidota bacterium]